jgi:hypothetical protein
MPKIRKNERVRTLIQQIERNGYQVFTRGLPTFIASKQTDLVFVYVRRKRKKDSYRGGDPLKGINQSHRKVINLLKEHGLKVGIY